MACIICQYCDRLIDLDWNVEHEEDCAFEHGINVCEHGNAAQDCATCFKKLEAKHGPMEEFLNAADD